MTEYITAAPEPPNYKGLEQHPIGDAFPDMGSEPFGSLIEDIGKNGLLLPIVLYEGMVLDGWHRYCAAPEAGVELTAAHFIEYRGDDPVGYACGVNFERRHVPKLERAAIVARIHKQWRPSGETTRSAKMADLDGDDGGDDGDAAPDAAPAPEPQPVTTAEMAQQAGVSERTMERGKQKVAVERGEREPDPPPPDSGDKPARLTRLEKVEAHAESLEQQVALLNKQIIELTNERDHYKTELGHLQQVMDREDDERLVQAQREISILNTRNQTEASQREALQERANSAVTQLNAARSMLDGLRRKARDGEVETVMRRLLSNPDWTLADLDNGEEDASGG